MKLFTKDIDKKLFAQYDLGANLETQKVIAKIFNPYGRGTWYIINSDPSDPDYLWAIVDLFEVESGSVSRSELESLKVPPFGLHLERDSGFTPINAAELYKGLLAGKHYKEGGETEQSENKEMILSQAEELEHHVEEFEEAAKKSSHVPAWIVAKVERAATDMSDAAHYLDAQNELKREEKEGEEEYALGGEVKWQEADFGDSALVISENKMGIIMKPYGRKFHLKFVDGTEKTYDANDLKFFKDMDEFDLGGKMTDGGKLKNGKYKYEKGDEGMYEGAEVRVVKLHIGLNRYEYNILDEDGNVITHGAAPKEKFERKFAYFPKMAKGGMMENGGSTSSPNSEFMKWFVDWSKGVNKYVYVSITKPNEFSSPVKDDSGKIVILDVIEKKGDTDAKKYINEMLKKADEFGVSIYLQPIPRTHNLKSQEHKDKITKDYLVKYYQKFGFENTDGGFMVRAPKMASGGSLKKRSERDSIRLSKEYQKVLDSNFDDKVYEKYQKLVEETQIPKQDLQKIEHYVSITPKGNRRDIDIYRYWGVNKMAEGGELSASEINATKAEKWWDRLKQYEREQLSKEYKELEHETFEEWVSKVYAAKKKRKFEGGGDVKFKDKVASIKASLLKRKKVPKAVQKDYGKTFSPAEAEDSAKRIVGAQTARERLMMRIKSKKKK